MSQRSSPAQELSEPNLPLLDTQYILQYEPSAAIIGMQALSRFYTAVSSYRVKPTLS